MSNRGKAIIAVCLFVVITFLIAFYLNPQYPAGIIAGESSDATWLSSIMLGACAAFSLVISMHRGRKWVFISVFFALLSLDEHFMFHERIKERIIFNSGGTAPKLISESPVIVGMIAGLVVAYILWNQLASPGRRFLVAAIILGMASAIIDIFSAGVLVEDSLKVIAELAITCAMLTEVGRGR